MLGIQSMERAKFSVSYTHCCFRLSHLSILQTLFYKGGGGNPTEFPTVVLRIMSDLILSFFFILKMALKLNGVHLFATLL